jgi:hypothetical protein
MVEEAFKSQQDKLFARYYWAGAVSWMLAALATFAASLTTPDSTGEDSYGPLLLWTGILILIIATIYRYFLRQRLQSRCWDEYAKILKGSQLDVAEKFHRALAGPVVAQAAYSLSLQRAITGKYWDYPVTLQDVKVTYQKDTPGKDNATFDLRYMIQAVELPAKFPHVFVVSKQNKKKKISDPGNLWSLASKLDPAQRLQNLEGDFGKYFEVYTPHKESGGLVFKKEIDALRVLTPDVMLVLRDNGFNFDYEIYGNYLYVIHEPNLLTAAELENFISSLNAALSEILPQLTGHEFTDDGMKLTIRKAALTMDILFGPLVKPAKLALAFLVIIFLGALISSLQ